MSKRNVEISKSNGTMWKCEVTDSYGITHVNYWEHKNKRVAGLTISGKMKIIK